MSRVRRGGRRQIANTEGLHGLLRARRQRPRRRAAEHGEERASLHSITSSAATSIASSGATAAIGEQFCTHGGQDPQKGDSVACYSDDGCRFAASLGAEPVRNFSPSSTPFALARGKITGMGVPRRPQRKPRAPASVVLACEMIKERARPDLIDRGFLRI